MIRLKPLLAALAVATLAACAQKAGTDAKDNVAMVDGHPISRNTYLEYAKSVASKPAADLTAEQRDVLLKNLIRAEVIAAAAEADGTAALNETRAAIDLSRLQILQKAGSQSYLKDRRPSEEELRAEYDIQITQLGKTEYRASQILVPTEDAAKQIIVQLKAGANFAQLAKAQSIDSGSRDKGGDLDWFTATEGPLVDVIKGLKKGETTAEPVKTQYGYHVLRLVDTRDVVPPLYDKVKERLVQIVEQKKWTAHVDALVAKAKVTKSL